jgi:hypothetical protein
MDRLTDDIQKTIRALESMSESSSTSTPLEQIDALLDQLFQQKTDLAGVTPMLNSTSPLYHEALRSMAAAASKAERAAKGPAGATSLIPVVEDAIGRLAKLLDSLGHSPGTG